MIEIFRGYVRTRDKKPIQKFKGVEELPTLDEVKNMAEYAGILNDQFTVMDVDDSSEAQRTYRLVCDLNLNCRVTKTTRGMHFIFKKNQYANKGNTHQVNALGFTFDIRTGVNQYIVVKKDNKVREIIREFDETKPLTEYPKFFAPIRNGKSFTGFKEGDGRNGALFTHIVTLFHNGFTKEEIKDICNWINDYAFDEPLNKSEMTGILRDESFSELKHNSAVDDFGKPAIKPETQSDVGMAELFAKHYKEEVKFNNATGWIVWSGKVWEMNELAATRKYIEFLKEVLEQAKKEMFATYSESVEQVQDGDTNTDAQKQAAKYYKYVLKMCDAGKISAVMKLAKSYMEIDIAELDANPYELNTPEGIINLKTGEMMKHNPSSMCTKITAYSPSIDGMDMWDDFLNTITENNNELKKYLQTIAGAISIGKVYHEGLVIAHGDGANGKSTLFNTIFEVLGDYSGKIPAESLTTKGKNSKVDLAELLGKRFILASETEEGQRLSISMLKQIASVDTIVGEKKYHDPFYFEPSHTTVLYTNFLPKVGSNDKGTWRRLYVAPFTANITNPQKDFAEKLLATSSKAVLKWIVDGAKMFLDNNYNLPKCDVVEKAINQYREENDWLSAFINDCCNVGPLEKVQGGQLYKVYKEWCQELGEYVRRNRDFAEALRVEGFTSKKTKAATIWEGLSINANRNVGRLPEEEFLK